MRRDIVLNTRNKQVYCRQCDLEDFDNIRAFVQKLSKGGRLRCNFPYWSIQTKEKCCCCTSGKFELDRIDGVVHNAAMMDAERRVNKVRVFHTARF